MEKFITSEKKVKILQKLKKVAIKWRFIIMTRIILLSQIHSEMEPDSLLNGLQSLKVIPT